MPRAAKSSAGAATSSVTARTRCAEAVARDVLRSDAGELRIDLDQRHLHVGTRAPPAQAPRRRRPRRTRPRGRRAARRSPPPAGWRRGRPGGRASSASAAAGRRAPHRRSCPAADRPIAAAAHAPSPASSSSWRADLQMLFVDHDAARQHAERAFEHAHVLVEHHMRNVGALEQRLDRGDQHRIVGPDELAQCAPCISSAAALRPARAARDRPAA